MSTFSQTFEAKYPAQNDFRRANFKGYIRKIVAFITNRSNQLQDLKSILRGANIRNRHYNGTYAVRIDQITGSEGRTQDFDQDFNPLKRHNRDRWVSIAFAWLSGVYLPAVELIKIKDIYIVRDGHHRISVARYMGAEFIDAQVTEWILAD